MAGDAHARKRRRKQTPWTVKFGDAFVSRLIAIGGIGTIAAILLVVLVLVGTALPLFRSPSIAAWRALPLSNTQSDAGQYRHFGIDENGLMLWGMLPTGQLQVRSIHDGQILNSVELELPDGVSVTASTISIDRSQLAVGLSDGTFRFTTIRFESTLLSPLALPTDVRVSSEAPVTTAEGSVYQWFDATGVRRIKLSDIIWSEPKSLGSGPVLALDYLPDDSANLLAAKSSAAALAVVGRNLVFAQIETKTNRLTKKTVDSLALAACELQNRTAATPPLHISLINDADQAIVVWPNGTLDRYALADGTPKLAESQTAAIQRNITCAAPLLARQTLLCGLDDGRLQGWMITRTTGSDLTGKEALRNASDSDGAAGGYRLTLAHEVQLGSRPITSVVSSANSHVAAASNDQNQLALVYVTTNNLLKLSPLPGNEAIQNIAFGPNSNSLVALSDRFISIAELASGHPEASLQGYFGRVWYEGHEAPKYIWQSSAATVQSEIKLSLMPLIFGTLKATFYAMLISIPLAILAAIYTSEFISPTARERVKPVIEMMASLPSVVLGYVAAIVVAPYLQAHLMAVLLAMLVIPLSFVIAGNLWNLLPVEKLVRFESLRLLGLVACLPVAFMVVRWLSPLCEQILFQGSILRWLNARAGNAASGWFLLLTPMMLLIVCMLMFGPLAQWQRAIAMRHTPRGYALFSLLRLTVVIAAVIVFAWVTAAIISGLGLDLRGYVFDSYQDRNALLVGFALGFCVIPIVYTISDDALQAVPKQLRSASLGCGATPLQTTLRVVVPSAMSGLFSAVMIGLGRAVGETMVVLCAAGNTPLMEFNPFNGFKTLSAALATELPEAAKGSTHFRTLFLAAVLLFFMTLVVNTIAEYVRIRFRKRSSQL